MHVYFVITVISSRVNKDSCGCLNEQRHLRNFRHLTWLYLESTQKKTWFARHIPCNMYVLPYLGGNSLFWVSSIHLKFRCLPIPSTNNIISLSLLLSQLRCQPGPGEAAIISDSDSFFKDNRVFFVVESLSFLWLECLRQFVGSSVLALHTLHQLRSSLPGT